MNLQTKSIFQLRKIARRQSRYSISYTSVKRRDAIASELLRRNIFGNAKVDVLKRLNATRSRRHSEARALWEGFSYMMTLAN